MSHASGAQAVEHDLVPLETEAAGEKRVDDYGIAISIVNYNLRIFHVPARKNPGTPALLSPAHLTEAPSAPRREGESILRRKKHLQAPSDIAGSGGAPRLATGWETEARSVPHLVARIVNTEGPRT